MRNNSLSKLVLAIFCLATLGLCTSSAYQGFDETDCLTGCGEATKTCRVHSLIDLNERSLNERLTRLIEKHKFLRLYLSDFHASCPFWAVDQLCSADGNTCSVCTCDPENIPDDIKQCDAKCQKATCDVFTSLMTQKEKPAEYVDLMENPETFTGYTGPSSGRVWSSIYNENCANLCLSDDECANDQNILYRLISSMHSATTVSIIWDKLVRNESEEDRKSALEMIHSRLLDFPDRVDNIYFALFFTLRAAQKAKTYFEEEFDFGSDRQDITDDLDAFFTVPGSEECVNEFKEDVLITPEEKDIGIEDLLFTRMDNITSLLNCVECVHCRMHAKLSIHGFQTALRVLFTPENEINEKTINRNDMVALLNTILKFSDATHRVEVFKMLTGLKENPLDDIAREEEEPQIEPVIGGSLQEEDSREDVHDEYTEPIPGIEESTDDFVEDDEPFGKFEGNNENDDERNQEQETTYERTPSQEIPMMKQFFDRFAEVLKERNGTLNLLKQIIDAIKMSDYGLLLEILSLKEPLNSAKTAFRSFGFYQHNQSIIEEHLVLFAISFVVLIVLIVSCICRCCCGSKKKRSRYLEA